MEKNLEWFLDPLKHHYFDFDGRVTRQTFWMFTLWYAIIYVVISVVSDEVAGLFALAVLLPSLGLGARRLHDIGKSGWWQLIGLIPVIGWIVIIVWLATQGSAGANEYGADPRASAPSPMPVAPVPSAPAANPESHNDSQPQ
jgi:uncharacterized membrane protein YhaH (DUF805 family)